MQGYVIGRLASALLVAFTVVTALFFLIRLMPGSPLISFLGDFATKDQIEPYRERLGLNDPLPEQYWHYVSNALQGDLGKAPLTGDPVAEVVVSRFPATAELIILGLVSGVLLGMAAGILAAWRRNSVIDVSVTTLSTMGLAIPSILLGVLFLVFFGVILRWFPVSGYVPFEDDPIANLHHMALPVLTIAIHLAPYVARQTRTAMVDVLQEDYVRTARSKGLRENVVVGRHALHNAMVVIITIIGYQAARLAGGTVIVETIFAIPGIGRLTVEALLDRDYITIQGVTIIIAMIVVTINTLTDLTYAWIDPRIRYGRS